MEEPLTREEGRSDPTTSAVLKDVAITGKTAA